MNKLYPFAVLVLFWTIGGEFSKAQVPDATLTLEQEVAHFKRNLTALWKLVRILQAQIIVQSHGGPGVPTHTISGPDHLDAARSHPGTASKRVHVHFHDGHLHLHETRRGRRYNATHAHSEHSHRHGDHYHFHDDMGNAPPHGTPEDHGGMHRHGDHWHYAGGAQPQQPQRTTPGPDNAEPTVDVDPHDRMVIGMHRHGDHWHYAGGPQPQQLQRTNPGPDNAEPTVYVDPHDRMVIEDVEDNPFFDDW